MHSTSFTTMDLGSIPDQVIPKTKKYLMPPCLTHSIVRYRSRVRGAILEKEYCPPYTLVQ